MSLDIVEELLPEYLSGDISDSERMRIDEWRKDSPENEALYQESLKAWNVIPLLHEMEQFNSFKALEKVNSRINKSGSLKWRIIIQRAAAILLLPLLFYSGYITIKKFSTKKLSDNQNIIQTVTTRQGMITHFSLADCTKVWLNSGSQLHFPVFFNGKTREVELEGEAFFDVAKNDKMLFRVNTKDLKIDVQGTSFNVVSYGDETRSEIVVIEGKVSLSAEVGQEIKGYGSVDAGHKAVYTEGSPEIQTEDVEVEKYISWRDGILIFRDDSMEDVIRRLSRWFNVEIIINDPEIRSYIYTAKFSDETLEQVLNLLKLSAPIDFRTVKSKVLPDNEFTKPKIYIMKKKV